MPKDTADTFAGVSVPGVGERVLTNLAHSSRLLSSCTQSNSLEDLGYSAGYGKQDCLKLIRELNRELSTYHTILLGLNLHSDCDKVHEDLKRSCRKALDMVHVLRVKLPSRGLRPNQDHHMEVEKLWCLFVSCLDSLYVEMNRTLTLQEMLLMHSDSSSFMNLYIDDMNIHIAEQLETLSLSNIFEKKLKRREEISQLERDIIELSELLEEIHSFVEIKLSSTESADSINFQGNNNKFLMDSDQNCGISIESSAMDGETSCQQQFLCWIIVFMVAVFLSGTVVGICIAFLS